MITLASSSYFIIRANWVLLPWRTLSLKSRKSSLPLLRGRISSACGMRSLCTEMSQDILPSTCACLLTAEPVGWTDQGTEILLWHYSGIAKVRNEGYEVIVVVKPCLMQVKLSLQIRVSQRRPNFHVESCSGMDVASTSIGCLFIPAWAQG